MNRDKIIKDLRIRSIKEMEKASKDRLRDRDLIKEASENLSGTMATPFSGFALDGPLSGATVLAVEEGVTVQTDANGEFTFPFTPAGEIRVYDGVDTITGLDFTGILRSTPRSTVISPITTAIREIMDQGYDEDQATNTFFEFGEEVLGIPVDESIREEVKTVNFVVKAAEGRSDMVKAQALATALEAAAETSAAAAEEVDEALTLNDAKAEYYKRIGTVTRDNNATFSGLNESTKTAILESMARLSASVTENEYRAIKEEVKNAIQKIKDVALEDGIDPNFAVTRTQAFNKLFKSELAAKIRTAAGRSFTKEQVQSTLDLATTAAKVAATAATLPPISTQVSNVVNDSISWPSAIGFSVTQNSENQDLILNYMDDEEYNFKPTFEGGWIDESTYTIWWNNVDDQWEAGSTLGTALLTGPSTPDSPIGNYTHLNSGDQATWGTLSIAQVAPGVSDGIPDPPPPPPATAPDIQVALQEPNKFRISLVGGPFSGTGGSIKATVSKGASDTATVASFTNVSAINGTFRITLPSKTNIQIDVILNVDGVDATYQIPAMQTGQNITVSDR